MSCCAAKLTASLPWWVAALGLLLIGCSGVSVPALGLESAAGEPAVAVLVPGITGSRLCDADGDVAWGNGARLFSPRDGGRALALPMDAAADSGLVPCGILEEIRVAGLLRKPIYGPIVELMVANGYRRGDLEAPGPGETFFTFAYDWRRDNVENAAHLERQLEELRRARGEERLRVDLICQSNGAHICRYLAKYGGAPLAAAAAGDAAPSPTVAVRKIVLIGTSNGGSLRLLRMLDRGRRYAAPFGRKMVPEVLFTLPALYQDLPVYRDTVFVDAAGEPLGIDLFDASAWHRHGLSIFDPEIEDRLEDPFFGDTADRLAFLERMLQRARTLHTVLRRDVEGWQVPRYYLIQNVSDDTPDAVVLAADRGRWQLRFSGDRGIDRDVERLIVAPGDGHATFVSQRWLSPQETAALAGEQAVVGEHFELILEPLAMRRLVEFLRED